MAGLLSRHPLCIFDLDGTLVDSFPDIRRSLIAAFRAIGIEPGEELLARVRCGIGLERFYCEATGSQVSDSGHGEVFDRFVDSYLDDYRCSADCRPFDGIHQALDAMVASRPDALLAVATTKRTAMARWVLGRAGLEHYFAIVRGSDGLPHKPDPAILAAVAKQAGVEIGDAVMVGDTDRDVLAAQAAGCTAVAVGYGGWGSERLRALVPDHLVEQVADLAALMVG